MAKGRGLKGIYTLISKVLVTLFIFVSLAFPCKATLLLVLFFGDFVILKLKRG